MTPMAEPFISRLLRIRRVRQLLALSLLGAVSVCAAFLLPPSRFTPQIPGDEALGTVFTSGTLKANRDYDVLDPDTTALKREEAARSVQPVYDYDGGSADTLQRRIGDAFALGRDAVAAYKLQYPARGQRLVAGKPDKDNLEFLLSQREGFWKAMQAVLDDEDYLEIARTGFDPVLERAAQRLAGLAQDGFVVEERGLLAADRERGIVVRTVAGPPKPETAVRDFERIRDLARARGEVDKLASDQLGELPQREARAVAALVRRALRPNLAYDDAETRRRESEKRAQVKDVILQIKKGEKIIGDGEQITKAHLLVFHAILAAGRATEAEQVRWGGGLFAALVCAAFFEFGRRNVRRFRGRSRDVLLLAGLLLAQLAIVRGWLFAADLFHESIRDALPAGYSGYVAQLLPAAAPFALGSLLVRFLLSSEAALVWTAAFAPLCGLLAGGSLQVAVAALVGGVVAADRIGHAGSKSAVFRAGLFTGLSTAIVLSAFALFQGRFFSLDTIAADLGGILGGAVVIPLFALALSPALEALFGYVTDIELLKLANFNHPVLKDLIVQAPGTYHHAILIGQLVEAAAREIGANPLLARVGAYYHDIGKGKNPLYFGENQKGENRHDQLAPRESAYLIMRHVSEGVELAKAAKLPPKVIEFIPQHHGTRLIGHFFHRAKEEAERRALPPPDEAEYRYPGPRPQTREAALIMIADMVVALSRELTSGAPDKLRQLVDSGIEAAVSEGQLDECEITLKDLENTAQSFVRSLQALYARAESGDSGPRLRVLEPDRKRA
jgi:hypothetical protein